MPPSSTLAEQCLCEKLQKRKRKSARNPIVHLVKDILLVAAVKLLNGGEELIGGNPANHLVVPFQILEYQTDVRRCRFDTLGKSTPAHRAGAPTARGALFTAPEW